jgi:hypothetical protein
MSAKCNWQTLCQFTVAFDEAVKTPARSHYHAATEDLILADSTGQAMSRHDDNAELRRLYADLQVAIEEAVGAASAAPKPLKGEALQRYLHADAKVMDITRRIKEMRTTRKRSKY